MLRAPMDTKQIQRGRQKCDRVRRSGRLCLEQSGRITNQIVIELRQANL
jgi:hypothetical protein